MQAIFYLRLIIGILFLLASLTFFVIEVMGVFRMKYVLNRMHSAAIGDALALLLAFIGLIVLNGINFTTFKLFMVPIFMFATSPVSSHLIARMEIETTKDTDQFYRANVRNLDNIGKTEEEKE